VGLAKDALFLNYLCISDDFVIELIRLKAKKEGV